MKTNSTLQQQGSPILLLAHLHRTFPHLPAARFTIDAITPQQLTIHLYGGQFTRFEAWRTALGLMANPSAENGGASWWLTVSGTVADVPVKLTAFGDEDEVLATVQPAPGELAEQRHLVDPLDHVWEHLADENPAEAAVAGSIAAQFPLLAALRAEDGAL